MSKKLILIAVLLLWPSFIFADNFPFIGVVTKEGVNVRAGANANFESLFQVKKNDKIIVRGKSYNWYRVSLSKDINCFISTKYVKAIDDKSGVVSADRVNIRAQPGENYSIIGQARKGEIIKINGKNDGWYAISPSDNCYGWIHEKFIKFSASYNEEEANNILKKTILADKTETADRLPPFESPPPKTQGDLFEAVGIVGARGKIINRQGSHKLIINGKPAYYLDGQPAVLDSFINLRVRVSGEKRAIPSSDLPVIKVKRIIASP